MKSKKFIAILVAIITILYLISGCGGASANTNEAVNAQQSIKNTVVFLTFESQGDNFPDGFSESIYKMYETATHSVKNYLLKQSRSKLLLQTQILQGVGGEIIASDMPVEYYKPRYKWINGKYNEINEQGYDNRYFDQSGQAVRPNSQNSLPHIDGVYREQLLIREILSKIKLPSDYKGDLNSDGLLDSLVIITDCEATGEWGDILWPHAGTCYDFSSQVIVNYFGAGADKYKEVGSATLGDLNAYYYNVLTSSAITSKKASEDCAVLSAEEGELYNIGLLAHESLHLLGLADYYSYEDSKSSYESVGEFDVMGSTQSLPQNMLAYTRLKLGWLDYENILYVNESGSYTLPLSMAEGKVAVKIIPSDYIEKGEYFMAELRSASLATADCAYDGGLYGDGLIIYRVAYENAFISASGGLSSQELGNMYGADEVYVFRKNAQKNKKLSSPLSLLKTSYAMLANGKEGHTLDLSYYRYDSYGNKDLSKNLDNLYSSTSEPSETVICYSDGSNSGILVKDVTLHKETQTVTFTVELPEGGNNQNSQNFNNVIAKRLPNGAPHLRWRYDDNYENVSVKIVRSTNRLKKKAENNSLNLKKVFTKAESSFLYTLLETKSAPIDECGLTLNTVENEALVFVCMQKENGECDYFYAGSLTDSQLTFNEYLFSVFDAVYVILFFSAFVLVVAGLVALIVIKTKSKTVKLQ